MEADVLSKPRPLAYSIHCRPWWIGLRRNSWRARIGGRRPCSASSRRRLRLPNTSRASPRTGAGDTGKPRADFNAALREDSTFALAALDPHRFRYSDQRRRVRAPCPSARLGLPRQAEPEGGRDASGLAGSKLSGAVIAGDRPRRLAGRGADRARRGVDARVQLGWISSFTTALSTMCRGRSRTPNETSAVPWNWTPAS